MAQATTLAPLPPSSPPPSGRYHYRSVRAKKGEDDASESRRYFKAPPPDFSKWQRDYENTRLERVRRRLPEELGEIPSSWLSREYLLEEHRRGPEGIQKTSELRREFAFAIEEEHQKKVKEAKAARDIEASLLKEITALREEMNKVESEAQAEREAFKEVEKKRVALREASRVQFSSQIESAQTWQNRLSSAEPSQAIAVQALNAKASAAKAENDPLEGRKAELQQAIEEVQKEVSRLAVPIDLQQSKARIERRQISQLEAEIEFARFKIADAERSIGVFISPQDLAWASLTEKLVDFRVLERMSQAAEEELLADAVGKKGDEALVAVRLCDAADALLRQLPL
eukprot:TRINITY_DN113805_c0_g1_i1.p1 TRINITY_DN113805_c0_g1~~TRINITY_DN113805_c0_g1_i1.p1  ORF type:complete len:360 (+),score=94.25 TRINITY_DN113805_c0_g1_i1:54-1082(+)